MKRVYIMTIVVATLFLVLITVGSVLGSGLPTQRFAPLTSSPIATVSEFPSSEGTTKLPPPPKQLQTGAARSKLPATSVYSPASPAES
jgi:hypothetical protein